MACVGFVGLGSMGTGMASNLVKHLTAENQRLLVWNRSPGKAEELVKQGAHEASSLEELSERCSVVMTMLGSDAALQAVFDTFLNAPRRPEGTIFVDHSTVAPKLTADLAQRAAAKGIQYVSSPVFGRPAAAAAKQLVVMAAGDSSAKQKVRPLLEGVGRAVIDVGEQPEHASVVKLVGNFYISSLIEMFAEGMALGQKNGVARDTIAQVASSLFPGNIAPGYAERIAKGSFHITPDTPGFALTGGMKDVGHVLQLGQDSAVSMPIAEIVMGHMKEVQQQENGSALDWGAITLAIQDAAQLPH